MTLPARLPRPTGAALPPPMMTCTPADGRVTVSSFCDTTKEGLTVTAACTYGTVSEDAAARPSRAVHVVNYRQACKEDQPVGMRHYL